MITIFWYALGRMRGLILGWGLGLAVLVGFLVRFYDPIADQQDQFALLLQALPQEAMVLFGDMSQIFTPAGYLQIEFFSYIPLILGIFLVSVSCGLLAGDEENGNLDLLLSYPISRAGLFFGRLMAYLTAVILLLGFVWVGFLVSIQGTRLAEIRSGELVLPLLSLGALLVFFGVMGLLLSMLLPSQRSASLAASLVLFVSFFLTVIARLDENLAVVEQFSPFHYYQGGWALEAINWTSIGILSALSVLMVLAAWFRFERRDIHLSS